MTNRPNMSPSDWAAVARYVSGEMTPDERAALETSATTDKAFAQLLSESLVGWTTAGVVPRQRDKQAAWSSIEQRLTAVRPDIVEPAKGKGYKPAPIPRRTGWYALAGAVAMVAAIVVGLRPGAARMVGHLIAPEPAYAYTTYTTANGERATIRLPDGNTVELNVASRLEVPTNYGAGNHIVRLPTGEALFTVSHHTGTPFTVIAGKAVARVLGTSFIIRHYRTDTVATVAVVEGKVAIGDVVVTARQFVEVGPSNVPRIGPADASVFAFATGMLTLKATQLSDAIPELNRWYDADIRLGDQALSVRRIAGTLRAGSIADLVELLEWTCDVRVVRDGRVLTLYPKSK